MNILIELLHNQQCSCVISNKEKVLICRQRGVKDLFNILKTNPEILNGAQIADKVIGKGASALLVLGKVIEVYADVISEPALKLLKEASIPVRYNKQVPNIINRLGTGICPVEHLCESCITPEECLPLIENFIYEA